MLHKKVNKEVINENTRNPNDPIFGSRILNKQLPKYTFPQEEISPRTAYQTIHDELMLDGNSRLNLATFVTTWMEPEARQLMNETFDKNMIDKDEYPQTAEIEMRCVNMLAHLYHADSGEKEEGCGCSTIGSSEAAMLCGMALKWNWKKRMQAKGKPTDKPNLVMSSDVQLCWEKFCVYWDIEAKFVPMEEGRYTLNVDKMIELCDENTIGVIGILGTTYTGEFQPISELNDAIDKYNKKTGYEVPIHVDGASGGFTAPFLQPDMEWDFRLKWVKSINASGHKFGLVYPGVGWAIWRDWAELPEELIFHVNYLGGDMPTFALNFSRPGNQVVAQYYNFIRLGFDGYKKIHTTSLCVANYFKEELEKTGIFVSMIKELKMPLIAFKVKEEHVKKYDVFDISEKLRHSGWLVPAYTLPEDCKDIAILRIVCKEGLSYDLATLLMNDINKIIADIDKTEKITSKEANKEASKFKLC